MEVNRNGFLRQNPARKIQNAQCPGRIGLLPAECAHEQTALRGHRLWLNDWRGAGCVESSQQDGHYPLKVDAIQSALYFRLFISNKKDPNLQFL